jgi:hypothetical protein
MRWHGIIVSITIANATNNHGQYYLALPLLPAKQSARTVGLSLLWRAETLI